jgi:hypothetical protein
MKQNLFLLTVIVTCLSIYSCKKSTTTAPTIVKQWSGVVMNTKYENPAPAGRTETGSVSITLYSDNTVGYNVTINNLLAGDPITAGHIHIGDPVTNGAVIVPLNPSFSTAGLVSSAFGTVNVTADIADSLQNKPIYVNFHTALFPGGLIRAQLDKTIDFATDVTLVGTNEVPSVTTTASGKALLRLTTDKILYSKVTITALEAADAITVSHIHAAAAGVNGSVIQFLCATAADFNISVQHTLSDALITSVKNDPVYVNAHSTLHPGGVVRGQIR